MTKISKQYSSFWLDEDLFDDEDEVVDKNSLNLQRVARLAAVRRAVANFVTILTGKNIKVMYSSGKQSKTDGEAVVISADDDPSKFDVMVGLALHEGSHILLSDFAILKSLDNIRSSLQNRVVPHMWDTPAGRWSVNPQVEDNLLNHILHPYIKHRLGQHPSTGHEWGIDTYGKNGRNYGNGGAPDSYFNSEYWANAIRILNDIQFIMNIIEDRRIDWYVYRTCGGYRPYYDALYNHYFFTKEVGRNLMFNPSWREVTLENYITRLLYAFHPCNKMTAMPGLPKLFDILDIRNIDRIAPENDPVNVKKLGPTNEMTAVPRWYDSTPFYTDMPIAWQVASELYVQMLKYCDLRDKQTGVEGQKGTPTPGMGEGEPDPSQLPNLDGGMPGGKGEPVPTDNNSEESEDESEDMTPAPVEKEVKGKGKKQQEVDGKFNENKAKKDRKQAEEVMNGQTKKKKVKENENKAIDALEQADAQMVDIKGDGIPFGRTMVTRHMSDALMEQDWFIFKRYGWKDGRCSPDAEASVAAGRRMGAILHHRLQVRNDPMITKQTRLQQGGLDRRLLAQLGMEITSVFQKSRTDIHKPVMLHLTLDASGSMGGKKWNKVRTVAVALAYIGSKLQNVDTVISIRGGNEMPIVSVIYDSRRDHFNRFIRYIKVIEPNGGTPEGLCYKATMDLILELKDTHDVYFINFSDGQPSFGLTNDGKKSRRRRWYSYDAAPNYFAYDGETAYKHTRLMIQMMRENGVKVLSYFISDPGSAWGGGEHDKQAFKKMYGEDAVYVNVENAGEVLRTLNKLLLARG